MSQTLLSENLNPINSSEVGPRFRGMWCDECGWYGHKNLLKDNIEQRELIVDVIGSTRDRETGVFLRDDGRCEIYSEHDIDIGLWFKRLRADGDWQVFESRPRSEGVLFVTDAVEESSWVRVRRTEEKTEDYVPVLEVDEPISGGETNVYVFDTHEAFDELASGGSVEDVLLPYLL